MDRIYMDYGATTPVAPEVADLMLSVIQEHYGNPSSIYQEGRSAKRLMENARKQVAAAIGAQPGEIFFTSGGSESDNWALTGIAGAQGRTSGHIILSAVEHHAVLYPAEALQRRGFSLTVVEVDRHGRVDPEAVRRAIQPNTCLISVMTANNEVGSIEPIAQIGAIAGEAGILFHSDGVQALGSMPIDVNTLGVDLMSFSAHKIYGPKGVGALYIRKGCPVEKMISGGAQERNRRAGTENVPGIAGFGLAVQMAAEGLEEHVLHLTALRQRLTRGILETIPGSKLMGHPEQRLPGNAHFIFEDIDNTLLLQRLDLAGISASAGSACTAGSIEPSHVLRAMGIPEPEAKGALRLTLGRQTTAEQVDLVICTLAEIIRDLRR